MSRAQQVPYVDGLTEGQGYNTYDQTGCVHGAVTVGRGSATFRASDLEYDYSYQEISDYKELAETLDISAAAGISKLDIGGSVEASFLSRKKFESSFLTYVVKVDVRHQPSTLPRYSLNWVKSPDPQKKYGDRFISGFVEGGALFARVSIFTRDSSSQSEVRQAAKAAFPVYGVGVSLSEEVKRGMETIYKHSEVDISVHYVGAPPSQVGNSPSDGSATLVSLKKMADAFLDKAQEHRWKRFAILERYTNLSNWEDQFLPLDYGRARDVSWKVFNDCSQYTAVREKIRDVLESRYTGGGETKDRLESVANDVIDVYRKWTAAVKANPEAAKDLPATKNPRILNSEVLLSIKRTKYIAQSLRLSGNRRTHIIDTRLREEFKAKKLFEFEAYDFGGMADMTSLVFQVKRDGITDKYSCVLGREKTPGYDELSRLWVADRAIDGVLDSRIDVEPIPHMDALEMTADGEFEPSEVLFTFYVRKL